MHSIAKQGVFKNERCLYFCIKMVHLCQSLFMNKVNKLDKKFTKSIKRLINDYNRLAKLYGLIEKARLRFFGYE